MPSSGIVTFTISASSNALYSFSPGGMVIINELFPNYLLIKYNATTASQITSFGNNTFQIPYYNFENGREYEFIIYTKTFNGITYLFGNQPLGLPAFRYRFRTFDFSFTPLGPILAGSTSLLIPAANLTYFDPIVQIGSYSVIYKTTSLNFTLNISNSDCGDINPFYTTTLPISQNFIELKPLYLNGCTMGNLTVSVNISRICQCVSPPGCSCQNINQSYHIDDQTYLNKSSYMQSFPIGYIGCHSSCLTCYDTTANGCSSCFPTGNLTFNLGGKCVYSCPYTSPIITAANVTVRGQVYLTKTCNSGCNSGMLPIVTWNNNRTINTTTCINCHKTCFACKGTLITDCTKCISPYPFLYNGSCFTQCPSGSYDSNMNCLPLKGNLTATLIIKTLGDASGFVTGANDVYLKATIANTSQQIKSIIWSRMPIEDQFTTFEKLFYNYTMLNRTDVRLRKEYFAQMQLLDSVTIIATAIVADSLNNSINVTTGGMVRFFKKPPLTTGYISISPNVGYVQSTYFQVYLSNWTFDINTLVELRFVRDSKDILIQQKHFSTGEYGIFTNVQFPSWGIVNSEETKYCSVFISASTPGGETVRASVNISLTNNNTKSGALNDIALIAQSGIFSNDIALQVSSILTEIVTNPDQQKKLSNPNSLGQDCSTNSDCSDHGICQSMEGGKKACICNNGWVGRLCNYDKAFLASAQNISMKLQNYIEGQMLTQSNPSLSQISTVASLVSNLAQVPELISPDLLDQMGTFLSSSQKQLTPTVVASMSKNQLDTYIDASLKVFDSVNTNYLVQKAVNTNDPSIKSSQPVNDFQRINDTDKLKASKDILYDFASKIATGLTQNSSYNFSNGICDAKVGAYSTNDLATGDSSFYAMNSIGAAFSVPPSLFTTSTGDLQLGNTANVRMVHWNGNPYTFTKSAALVQSDVVGFSFLNSTGGEISIKGLIEPILIKIQIPSQSVGRNDLACSYFDSTVEETFPYQELQTINVNDLNMTDKEKRAKYPEWDPILFKMSPLIVKVNVTKYLTKQVGDFRTDGCQIKERLGTTMVCQCNHLSDFALKINSVGTPTGPSEVPIPYFEVIFVKKVLSFLTIYLAMVSKYWIPSLHEPFWTFYTYFNDYLFL